jgi:hypothetical protein
LISIQNSGWKVKIDNETIKKVWTIGTRYETGGQEEGEYNEFWGSENTLPGSL